MAQKTENLMLRISPEVKSLLELRAARLGMNMSEYVRLLIMEDVRKTLYVDDDSPAER